jgi:hypothetical protein
VRANFHDDCVGTSPSLPVGPPTSGRRRVLRLLAAAGVLRAWPALAGFNFFTSEYTASRDELQAQLLRRFPLQQGYGELITVTLTDPVLGLDPATNRAAIAARVTIASPFLQPPRVPGSLTVSSALRYDPAALALRLEQPRADRIALDGVSGQDAVRLQRIGGAVAQEALQGQALRTFTREELTVGRKTYEIGAITVMADGIKVELK